MIIYFRKVFPIPVIRNSVHTLCKRLFLSSAFECKETWDNRLSLPIIQKVDCEAMYYELDGTFNRTKQLNPIDVDIFLNAQHDDLFLTEVEELTHKLRMSISTLNTLPTTHHAYIRLFLKYNKKKDLLRALDDRLNYGIFPDNYCTLYMINHFLKENDYRSASKAAVLRMIQEDFSNDLVKYMSAYSVLNYLQTSEPWDEPVETPPTNDDDEEELVKIKVPYLRNPYFDDHFDLKDGHQMCGKTLVMIASTLRNELAKSMKILGLALYNKWDKLENYLSALAKENLVLFTDSLKLTENIVKSKFEGEKRDVIVGIVNKLKASNCNSESMVDVLNKMIKSEVASTENKLIETQTKLYKEWENLREQRLQEFLDDMNRRKRLEEVDRKKEELKMKEELLYYFDNEDHIEVEIEKKEELIRKRTFPETVSEKEEDYVPPEVYKRVSK